jgi:hypothetical protein
MAKANKYANQVFHPAHFGYAEWAGELFVMHNINIDMKNETKNED